MSKRAVIISGIQVFPPESGGHLRTAQIARKLVRAGNTVQIYSMTGRKKDYLNGVLSGETSPSAGITEYVNRNRFYAALQFLSYRLRLPPFWLGFVPATFPPKSLRDAMKNANTVVIDFPYLHRLAGNARGKTVLNLHNVEHRLHQGGWLQKHLVSPFVEKTERAAVRNCDETWCCSEADKEVFQQMTKQPVVVVPNEAERIERSEITRGRMRETLGIPSSAKVILFAASQYAPNQDAFQFLSGFAGSHRKLLEKLNIYLLVVGSVSGESIRDGRLIVTGPVPTVDEFFSAADMAVNPVTAGSGTSLKMLQYKAAGIPVFSTVFGARGLGLEEGKDYIAFRRENLHRILEQELS